MIFATGPAAGGGIGGRAVSVVVVLLGARAFGWRLATDPTVTALFNGVAAVFALEGNPFPRRTVLSSFALGMVLEVPIALVAESVLRVKPRDFAGREGGGALSFSRASERFDRPVCFDWWDGAPDPSDEAGFVGDDSLGGWRFGSDHGFCGELAGARSTVLFMEDEVGRANEKGCL